MLSTRSKQSKPLTSGRVTPREVLEAYGQTGYTPMQAGFVDDTRACALGAIAAANEPRVMKMHGDAEIVAHKLLFRRGVKPTSPYVTGFVCGFDNDITDSALKGKPDYVASYRTGYRDGARARKFCFGSSE